MLLQGSEMGLAIINSRACIGVEAPEVTVEVHISNGMPGFCLVGLPETTVTVTSLNYNC